MNAEVCPHCGRELPLYLCKRKVAKKRVVAVLPPSAEVPADLVDLPLYAKDDKLRARWGELLATWKTAYPGLDIRTEVRKAHAWETACTTHRKVNRPKFLTNWLNRAQERASRFQSPTAQAPLADAPGSRQKALREAVAEWIDSPTWTGS